MEYVAPQAGEMQRWQATSVFGKTLMAAAFLD
jgi:hypothetical protein